MMMVFVTLLAATVVYPSMASSEVAVRHGRETVVRYQARIEDEYLIVTAVHEKGWHTYAMDNQQRAREALQGKKSLGIDKGIEIEVLQGVELDGTWLQTKPIDLSKPELRWFTFGFERTSFFACHVKKLTTDTARLRIRGQACDGETCCNVDVVLALKSVAKSSALQTQFSSMPATKLVKDLVPVEAAEAPTSENP